MPILRNLRYRTNHINTNHLPTTIITIAKRCFVNRSVVDIAPNSVEESLSRDYLTVGIFVCAGIRRTSRATCRRASSSLPADFALFATT